MITSLPLTDSQLYQISIHLFQNLEHWTSAWLDWNFALNEHGGPTLTDPLDATIIVNQTSGEFYKQPTFYAMGHFSKFLHPGSRRVQVSPSYYTGPTSYQSSAAVKDKAKDFMRNRILSSARNSSRMNSGLPSIDIPQVVRCLASSNFDGSSSVIIINT